MLVVMGGYLLFAAWYLVSSDKRAYLETPAARDRIGGLYKGVNLRKSRWAVLYYPMFVVKRFCFVFIPVVLLGNGAQ